MSSITSIIRIDTTTTPATVTPVYTFDSTEDDITTGRPLPESVVAPGHIVRHMICREDEYPTDTLARLVTHVCSEVGGVDAGR